MKISLSLLCSAVLVHGSVRADVISVNFTDTETDALLPEDMAGFLDPFGIEEPGTRVANWNNVQAAVSGGLTGLIKQDGTVTGAALAFTSNLTAWRLGHPVDATSTGDDKMWKGYLDVGGGSSAAPGATIEVTGIPFSGFYDVYIYFDGANAANYRIAQYEITSSAGTVAVSGEDSENADWGIVGGVNETRNYQIPAATGTGNAVWPLTPNNGEGNTLILRNVRGADFTLKAWSASGTPRAPINGFQIVTSSDSDGDGLPNQWESDNLLDPNDATGQNGADGDPDTDGLGNLGELNLGSNPWEPDTDFDGLTDLQETGTGTWQDANNTGTSPTRADSDGDGIPDAAEDPTQTTTGLAQPGTDPTKRDTDGDGADDATEVLFGTNPKLDTSLPALDPSKLDLLAYWPFNDGADPATSADAVRGIPGTIVNGATYTADGGGRTGQPGDAALDFGNAQAGKTLRVDHGGFLNLASPQDTIAISFWQKLHLRGGSTVFNAPIPSAAGEVRGLMAHATWSDGLLAWDTAGCCDPAIHRISRNYDGDLTVWRHFVFQKTGTLKEIWIDGQLAHSGSNSGTLPDTYTRLFIGSSLNGGEQVLGLIDDFAIFGDALTEGQILRLASGETPIELVDTLDSDSDGMPDTFEDLHSLLKNNPADASQDPDSDGLTNLEEFLRATNPRNADTDGDGLDDKVETATGTFSNATDTGTSPRNPDTDGDGLSDKVETATGTFVSPADTGTSPHAPDTDGDGYGDRDEVLLGTNPMETGSVPPLPLAVAYWPFDDQGAETTADASPNQHHGTVSGTPVYTTGQSGAAGDFAIDYDGVDDFVSPNASLLSGLSAYTLAGWIRMPVAQTATRVGLFGQNDLVEFGLLTSTSIDFWAPGGAITASLADNGGVLENWTHIAVVAGTGTRRLLINGVEAAAGTTTPGGTSTFNFNIGGGGIFDGTGNHFLGQIDDVVLWNKALTNEQIGLLATRSLTPYAAVRPSAGRIELTAFAITGNSISLGWAAEAGTSYRIQTSSDLSGWTPVGEPVTASGTTASWSGTLPSSPAPQRLFYRVIKE